MLGSCNILCFDNHWKNLLYVHWLKTKESLRKIIFFQVDIFMYWDINNFWLRRTNILSYLVWQTLFAFLYIMSLNNGIISIIYIIIEHLIQSNDETHKVWCFYVIFFLAFIKTSSKVGKYFINIQFFLELYCFFICIRTLFKWHVCRNLV